MPDFFFCFFFFKKKASPTDPHDSSPPLPEFRIRGQDPQIEKESGNAADEQHGPFYASVVWALFKKKKRLSI